MTPHIEDIAVGIMTTDGWVLGDPRDYDKAYAVDLAQLAAFLRDSQPDVLHTLDPAGNLKGGSPTRQQFLTRLQTEISKRGTAHVLRNGIELEPRNVTLFFPPPRPGDNAAKERFAHNRFTVTRRLHYGRLESQRTLDLCLFINGFPVATLALQGDGEKRTAADAIEEYRSERDPRDILFESGRCIVHFAVDESAVAFCTHLLGAASAFLPFDRGSNGGAGNPPGSDATRTEYLWRDVLSRHDLAEIIQSHAQVTEEKNEKTGKKNLLQLFPRYHQLDAVRKLVAHVAEHGAGCRYLIQHSTGGGTRGTIGWLATRLLEFTPSTFDAVVVVSNRRVLGKYVRETIGEFEQLGATIAENAEPAPQLQTFVQNGKRLMLATVRQCAAILHDITTNVRLAIIFDEPYPSPTAPTAASTRIALEQSDMAVEIAAEDVEREINNIVDQRSLQSNISFVAFNATPDTPTMELFGQPPDSDVSPGRSPFHIYPMKQAIEEGFTLDVLRSYTTVGSYYRLLAAIDGGVEFDAKWSRKKIRRVVENNDRSIRLKTEIMIDHFLEHVAAQNKIGGRARAMVMAGGIDEAIQYFHAFRLYLKERKSSFKAIAAFPGGRVYSGVTVTETSLNGFPAHRIADRIVEDPYRFLICVDAAPNRFADPLMHSLYVDAQLTGMAAVHVLTRLNRIHLKKRDTFVLDFVNEADTIRAAFAPFYTTTIRSELTDAASVRAMHAALEGRDETDDEE